MPHMLDGMTNGIDRNMHSFVSAARRMTQEMADAMAPSISVGLAADARKPIPMKPGQPYRYDDEYI
jgi:hypothetical protein